MTKELILKLLSALGVKIIKAGENPVEGELNEDDAVKLIEDLFKAENLGLLQKRNELLANETKLKDKINA